MTRNPMLDNLPQVDEQELIEKFQIPQENYLRYLELKAKPITRIGGRGRGRPYCPPDAFVEGYAHSNACELCAQAARGNRRRLMPEMTRPGRTVRMRYCAHSLRQMHLVDNTVDPLRPLPDWVARNV